MKAIALATVAGIAGIAAAQSATFTLTVAADDSDGNGIADLDFNETTTVTVSIDDDSPSGVFAYNVLVALSGADATASNLQFLSPNGFGSAGGINGDGNPFAGTVSSDFIGPTADAPLNGNIFSFDLTAGEIAGLINFSIQQGPAVQPPALAVFAESAGIILTPVDYDSISFNIAQVEVLPAPGSVAMLGLGGLVAARRRR